MSQGLQFAFEWLGDQSDDLIALSILLNGQPVTELEDQLARSVRTSARVAATPLARWLATNWWRLRCEPLRRNPDLPWSMSHCLGAIGEGFAWPDITFSSDGESVLVHARATGDWPGAPVRYLRSLSDSVTTAQFEYAVDCFIDAVIERTGAVDLHALWQEVREERNTPEQTAWRSLEAMLGFDPDEAPPAILQTLMAQEAQVGRAALEELACQSGGATSEHINLLLTAARKGQAPTAQVPDFSTVAALAATAPLHQQPWQRARHVAQQLRQHWGLGIEPITSKLFCEILALPSTLLSAATELFKLPLSAGARGPAEDRGRLQVLLSKPRESSRRFDLARLLADQLNSTANDLLLPVTSTSTARQKFQRAFAQEFLCPYAALQDFLGTDPLDEDRQEEAADYFQVSPLLIRTALANHGVLDRELL